MLYPAEKAEAILQWLYKPISKASQGTQVSTILLEKRQLNTVLKGADPAPPSHGQNSIDQFLQPSLGGVD